MLAREGLAGRAATSSRASAGGKVGDWSWRQTRAARSRCSSRLALPYKARTARSRSSRSLAYTLVALVPPLLAKLAVDEGITTGDLADARLDRRRLRRRRARRVRRSRSLQTYFTGWVGERALADLRIQLFAHLQRLSLGYYERNRTGAIISRITNDVEALDQLVTDGVTSLVQNLMLLSARPSSCSCSTGGSRSRRSSCSR